MDQPDFYAVLGVAPDADLAAVEAAYRALADGAGTADAEQQGLWARAHAVLTDPGRRTVYDELRRRAMAEAGNSPKAVASEEKNPEPSVEEAPVSALPGDPATSFERPKPASLPPAALLLGGGVLLLVVATALVLLVMRATAPKPAPIPPDAAAPAVAPVAPPPGAVAAPPDTMIQWDESEVGKPSVWTVGGLVVSLAGRDTQDGRVAVITVTAPNGARLERLGAARPDASASASFGVGWLDPTADAQQVIFSTFTGGAHCCASIEILELRGGVWSAIDGGSWDGEPMTEFPGDVDGDGRREFTFADNRFLYVFASYAESSAPYVVRELRGGRMIDVSAEPRYAKLHATDMASAQADCEKGNNGACAAFVADAARLGREDWAWPIMLRSYDRNDGADLPTGCRVRTEAACPTEQELAFATYPEALRWFLGENGYMPPMYLPPREPASGPSFDCGKAKGRVLKLICATPGLAQADRELAWAYTRAMALSPDRARVRDEERSFIRARDRAPADEDTLWALYADRISRLRASIGS